MEYQECGSTCPATCENHANPPVCIDVCVDGCFCPPGQVLLNSTSTECVEITDCPGIATYICISFIIVLIIFAVMSCNRMQNVQNFGPGIHISELIEN